MPEQILGTNMWQLFDNEFVEGAGGRIDGPTVLRIHLFDNHKMMFVQSGNKKIELPGENFELQVKTKS